MVLKHNKLLETEALHPANKVKKPSKANTTYALHITAKDKAFIKNTY